MKFSESWLREWVNPAIDTQQLVDQITMAGLEVDGVEPAGADLPGVIVGEIISTEQHPDADKLRVCQVAGLAEGLQQVVCGAPNARPGIKIPFATVGAALPPGEDGKPFKIKKAKLRGVESHGMLCSQTELQLGEDNSGLWELPVDAPAGVSLNEYLALNDQCIEVDLTPNRSDCLSIAGIAREVGVLNKAPVKGPEITPVAASISDAPSVQLNAGASCSRYAGRIIRNVDVTKPSPKWLQEKLRRSGLRSIDAIVDVTNYILLELGQPMHAFDLEKINGGINVRMAEAGEKLALLNGQEITLEPDLMVIADAESPLALAGIMGGDPSAVSEGTQHILLESAYFDPIAISGKARRFGLHTDSSHRFERGVDYQLQAHAIERATQLILEIVGGEAGPVVLAENDLVPTPATVQLRRRRILAGLGFSLADDEVIDILTRLGLELSATDDDGWTFTVPSYRFDISIEADLLEELARVYGYNNLPTTTMTVPMAMESHSEDKLSLTSLKKGLTNRGYQEAVCYSFVDAKLEALVNPEGCPIPLQNPISADMSVMRTTLWPGLLSAVQYNANRQQPRVRLFEAGLKFVSPDGSLEKLVQTPVLAAVVYGPRADESWFGKSEAVDFYDLKGDLEALLALAGLSQFEFAPGSHPALHPGQTAELRRNGSVVGVIGALHPQLQRQLGLEKPVYLFEVVQAALIETSTPVFAPLSKFPEVRRDIAVIVDRDVTAAQLQQCTREAAGKYLTELKIFDVYEGKGIDTQRKSVALGLTFQHPSSTLTDEQIGASVDAVVKYLEEKLNAAQR
ncbi:phenylalanine--tRNA ligase subunit beta [Halioxenophilus sp. WMMB6]|uniref:phenylalanine--tRNA ligase subunit beta n=1 Tax=Halioxenophilus sp. WMMB6 TaxID=3073815 RepID=UPI00295ED1F7|nr:phenylalanine--tRNA ligase subunit beta [Halioxenophilus sp. WMMB6]